MPSMSSKRENTHQKVDIDEHIRVEREESI